jgi:hypothetical protein
LAVAKFTLTALLEAPVRIAVSEIELAVLAAE